jgi:hypothetical protein
LAGDEGALNDAQQALDDALAPYIKGQNCRIGFVLISSNAPDVPTGANLSKRIGAMIEQDFPQLLPEPANGGDQKLAFDSVALPGATPSGQVELLLFLSSGCQPAG